MTDARRPPLAEDDPRPLPELVVELVRERASGALGVARAGGVRELILIDGEVRAARSSVVGERLGEWLAARGVISEQELERGLVDQSGSDAPPLGHILVRRGVVEAETLETELEALARAIVERATREPRLGVALVDEGARRQLDTLPNVTTLQLILEAARVVPDRTAKQRLVAGLEGRLRTVGPLHAIVEEVVLTPSEAFILSTVEPPRPLHELRSVVTLSEDDLVDHVYALAVAGLLVPAAEAPSATREQGPAAGLAGVGDDERAEIVDLVRRLGELDHYDTLGLHRGASYRKVFDAWEACRRRFDPGRAAEPHLADLRPQLEALQERAAEAYETLFDPSRRGVYDRILGAPAVTTVGTPSSVPVATAQSVPDPHERIAEAEAAERRGDLFEAHRILEELCRVNARPEALLRLAKVKLLNPNWTRHGLDALRRALELDPKLVEAWVELATFWRKRGHRERERKALERALALEPTLEPTAGRYRLLVGDEEADAFFSAAAGRG